MNKKLLILFLLPIIMLASCKRNVKPYPDASEQKQVPPAESLTKLTLSLTHIQDSAHNNVISPLSAAIVLAMASNGAEGETWDAFRNMLGGNESEINDYYGYIQELLDADPKMAVANGIYVNGTFPINSGFKRIVDIIYKSDVESLLFSNPSSVKKINQWVSDRTHGMIPTLLEKLRSDAAMVILNTIYFKAKWQKPFDPGMTSNDKFYAVSGPVDVPFMRITNSYNVYKGSDFNAVFMPYEGERFEMALLLPNKNVNIADFIKTLDTDLLAKMVDARTPLQTRLFVPKFTIETTVDLTKTLGDMGLAPAMNRKADFSGISSNKPLFISQILQKAKIEFHEEGTEAAAATAMTMVATSIRTDLNDMIFDRPFMFFIWDNVIKQPIFIGNVANPL